MRNTIQSTSRRVSTLLAISGTCAILTACSNQSSKGWFNLGKDTPQAPQAQTTQEVPSDQQQAIDSQNTQTPTESKDSSLDDPQSALQQVDEPTPVATDPAPEPQPAVQPTTDVDEVVRLYRRLHVEMEPTSRSQLIVELLNDPRERVRLLGFDLASRDLSSGATLSADAANAAVDLLSDPLPSVRTGAARLITRLALPDAMTLLTNALRSEENPPPLQQPHGDSPTSTSGTASPTPQHSAMSTSPSQMRTSPTQTSNSSHRQAAQATSNASSN